MYVHFDVVEVVGDSTRCIRTSSGLVKKWEYVLGNRRCTDFL